MGKRKEVKSLFLKNHEVIFVLFTDEPKGLLFDKVFICDHKPWPHITLIKFNQFVENESYFKEFDYCFRLDADCKIESEVTEAILGELTAVVHPGFCGGSGTPCFDPRSRASMLNMQPRIPYIIGAVAGGRTEPWLLLCAELDSRIKEDASKNVTAVWHDESHLLRFLNESPNFEKLNLLGWEYCFAHGKSKPTKNKIVISHRTKPAGFRK